MTGAELLLRERLTHGALAWSEVMRVALYDEAVGYYRYPRRIGRGGDFYTAVSVGPLYGRLLTELVEQQWQRLGCPAEFWVIEQGAHDGQLAEDVWLASQDLPLGQALRYCIIEERESYLQALRQRLFPLMGTKLQLAASPERKPYGMILCNELLDALPCERVRWTGSAWARLGVQLEGQSLGWCELEALTLPQLPRVLPVGYTTEVCLEHEAVLSAASALLERGAFFTADYGYTAEEYYHPDRAAGTLRRYYQHKTDDQVLAQLGEADLTAHVDFSSVQQCLEQQGWAACELLDQGRFLTRLAAPWLRTMDGQPPSAETRALLRQFQTLTHPGHMGSAFRCLVAEK